MDPPTKVAARASSIAAKTELHSNWLQRHFSHFCQSTTLHGWVFLVDRPMQRVWRVFWILVVLLSVCAAAFFLYYAINDYTQFKVQTTYGSERGQWKDVHFPAVTLCNINQARRSFFHSLGLGQSGSHSHKQQKRRRRRDLLLAQLGPLIDFVYRGTPKMDGDKGREERAGVDRVLANETVLQGGYLMRKLKLTYGSMSKAVKELGEKDLSFGEGSTSASLFRQASVQDVGHSYVLQLSYKGTSLPLDRFALLHAFFETDFGFCTHIRPEVFFNESLSDLSFESLMDRKSQMVRPNIKLGRQNGLSILLDTETFDYGYSPQDGEGFKLAVHHYLDHPNMQLSQADIGPGFETRVAVTPTLTKTTDQCKKRFHPEERHCYQDNEFHFVWLNPDSYRYSFDNCLIAAVFDEVYRACGCSTGPKGFNCNGTGLDCEKDIMKKLGQYDQAINTADDQNQMKCHSACDDETFDLQVTSARFPNFNLFLADVNTFCIVFRKVLVLCQSEHKREVIIEQYKDICDLVESSRSSVCVSNVALIVEEFLPPFAPTPGVEGGGGNHVMSIGDNKSLHAIVFRYARDNLARVNVFIRDTTLTSIVRDEKQPIIWFIANIGGLTGLAMGCSLVTMVEILYFVFVWVLRCFGVKTKEEEVIEKMRRTDRIRKSFKLPKTKKRSSGLTMKTTDLSSSQVVTNPQ